jgi:hypothetical protein
MNKNWTACIIASIVCKLLGLVAVLGFVFHMVLFTGSLHCLWLLFLVLILDCIPTYEFKREFPINKENKND